MEKQIRPEWVPSAYRENDGNNNVNTASQASKSSLPNLHDGSLANVPVSPKNDEEVIDK